MNFIDNLIDELKTSNCYFIPSVIEEFNTFVIRKLLTIDEIYKNDLNKYYLLGNLVNLGYELDNILRTDNLTLSSQLNFFSGIIKPVVNKIRDVCLKINLELVDEYKNQISNLIMSDLDKYDIQKKNIKFIQINCLCKNSNYSINKEIMFEEFGIFIKITNLHFKDIFKNLIQETNLPIDNLSNDKDKKDKKYDWYWKAIEYKNYSNICNGMNKQNILDSNFGEPINSNDTNINIIENFKIIQNIPNIPNIPNESIPNLNNINIFKPTDTEMSSLITNSIVIEDDSFSIPIDLDDNLTTTINTNL